jgi:transposase-like protein
MPDSIQLPRNYCFIALIRVDGGLYGSQKLISNKNMINTIADIDVRNRVIHDYIHTNLRVIDVAKKHNVSISTLVAWLRQAGIPRRPRGRRSLTSPLPRAQQILTFAVAHGFSQAAERFKISRQRVSGLARRWGVVGPQVNVRSRTLEMELRTQKRARSPRRELVICFRLRADELLLLRKSLPQSVTQATRSPHRLVRAAVLEKLDTARVLQQQIQTDQSVAPASAII